MRLKGVLTSSVASGLASVPGVVGALHLLDRGRKDPSASLGKLLPRLHVLIEDGEVAHYDWDGQ